jgi:predicted nucleic acid-binding protein
VRAALNTNTVVSGFLWEGAASELLTAAREQRIYLYTSADLLAELIDVLPHRYALLAVRSRHFDESTLRER